MADQTEGIRREMVAEINSKEAERAAMEAEHGQVWDTDEMSSEFQPIGFLAPFVIVQRKADGAKGSLMFQHMPRYYYGWAKD